MNRLLALSLLLLWAAGCQPTPDLNDPAVQQAISEANNLGIAYLEENRLDDAEAAFRQLIDLNPADPSGPANLGVVFLRRGDFEAAEAILLEAIELDPADPAIRISLAEVYVQLDRIPEARSVLDAGLETQPDHVPTLYKRAQLDAEESPAQYANLLREVVYRAPSNVVPRLFYVEALVASGQSDSALVHLDQTRQLVPELPREAQPYFDTAARALQADTPTDATLSVRFFHNLFKVTPYYQTGLRLLGVRTDALAGAPIISEPPGLTQNSFFGEDQSTDILETLRFTDATQTSLMADLLPAGDQTALAVADINADGEVDVFASVWDDEASISQPALLLNTFGRFQDSVATSNIGPLDAIPTGARFDDIDNDTFLDLLVTTASSVQLWHNRGDQTYTNITEDAGLASAGAITPPLFADFDHDGDLDLFLPQNGPDFVYRNNGDLTFTEVDMGLAGGDHETQSASFADFDDDGDLDLFITYSDAPPALMTNTRRGTFEPVALPATITSNSSAIGDFNNDGLQDVVLLTSNQATLLENQGQNQFAANDLQTDLSMASSNAVRFLDFDNDGFLDLLLLGDQLQLLHNDGTGGWENRSDLLPDASFAGHTLAVGDYNLDRDLDLFLANESGVHLLRNDGGHLNQSLSIQTRGLLSGNSKNNYYSIGAKVEVRAGDLYQTRVVTDPVTTVGLGKRLKADVIRIVFTNGVPQNIFRPGTDQDIIEQQILKGSCPFVYAWDGEQFTFAKDFLWRSALGMATGIMGSGETVFAPAGPAEDYIKISGKQLKPKDGQYLLQLTGELWEVPYLDEVALLAIDHPATEEVYIDESFGPPPALPLPIYSVASPILPVSAVDGQGVDVLPNLLERDERYVAGFGLGDFQGITEAHALTLDPGQQKPTALYLQGWLFPTDASINESLSQQPNTAAHPPELQVLNANGEWETVIPSIGFPMGKRKTMRIDLEDLYLSEDYRIRLLTNMQIYWDRAFFSAGSDLGAVVRTTMKPAQADFHYRGFSRLYRTSPFAPHLYDYQQVEKESPWLPIPGPYTRYGDVLPLLEATDSQYVIMAPGDEITVSFDAAVLPALPEGWTRDFILYSNGWLKDADLNIAEGGTVEPLPFLGMRQYPYAPEQAYPKSELLRRYHAEYNTRRVGGEY